MLRTLMGPHDVALVLFIGRARPSSRASIVHSPSIPECQSVHNEVRDPKLCRMSYMSWICLLTLVVALLLAAYESSPEAHLVQLRCTAGWSLPTCMVAEDETRLTSFSGGGQFASAAVM